jgi:hypothetical protein
MRRADRPFLAPAAAALAVGVLLGAAAGPGRAETSGTLLLGWRHVDVSGDGAAYDRHVNLRDGPWLPALELAWRDTDGTRGGAPPWRPDGIELRLSDLGDEPWRSARLAVRREDRYRFSWDRSESEYVRDDLLVRPENASVEGATGGDFRRFDLERVRDRLSLSVDATARTTLALGYERQRRSGDGTAPVDVSREVFVVQRPVDETLDTVEVGISHTRERFSLNWTERYRRFDFDSSLFLPGFSEGDSPDAPTALDTFVLDQPYTLDGFEHQLTLRYRPTDRLSLTGNLVAADVDVSLRARERAEGTAFTGAPLAERRLGSGDLDQDRRLVDLGAAWRVSERVELFARVRSVTLEQTAELAFEPDGSADWDIDGVRLETGAEWVPDRVLRLAAGATRERRDVRVRRSVAQAGDRRTRDTDSRGWFARAWYRPSRRTELHLAVEEDSIDDPFTLASPTSTTRYRLRGRHRFDAGITVTASYLATDRENGRSGWTADAERLDLRAAYSGERLALSAGLGRTDLARSVDSLVVAGTRAASFDIDYRARADTLDASASWRFTDALSLGASYRRYDNGRSFAVDRDDWRLFLRGRLDDRYRWGLEHRRVDYDEGGIEDFRSRILELSLGLAW